jgi:hypothetical protein
MKALSIKQPWASLIAHGIKDIENRTWKAHFRGRIFIHACGKSNPKENIYSVLNQEQWEEANDKFSLGEFNPDNLEYSAIIGEVDIIDCVINYDSIWAEKSEGKFYDELFIHKQGLKPIYNWVLANPVLYEKPILNVKGKLSFWEPDICIQKCESCETPTDIETMSSDADSNWFCSECWEELFPIMEQEAKEARESEL